MLFFFNGYAQNFYDRASVQTIELFFGFSDWDSQLEQAEATDTYILADSIRINATYVLDSVGVKYKGNSSYNPNNIKNPLHIELDHFKGSHEYQGYTDIKLQNGFSDPSMIREVLSYAILEQYMDCPKSNFANVYINGSLIGLYSNAESINKKFCGEKYYRNDEARVKCNPVGGAGPGSSAGPDLNFINTDTTSYYSSYEMKSDYGWSQLLDLINVLNNNFSQIEELLDVDRALWMLAYNNVLVNLDSYNGAFRQNYYLTWDYNNRFAATIWDLNMSFGGFPGGAGSGPGSGGPTLDPLSNNTSSNHPLIVKMLSNERYKKMYLAHLRTIVQEVVESQAYLSMANEMRTTIDAHVQADPNKFYSYTQFQNSLTTNIAGGGPPGSSIPGIQLLMSDRLNYLSTNSNYLLAPPLFVSHSVSNSSPNFGEEVSFSFECSNELEVFIGYRTDTRLKFTKVQMFDDGNHNDGSAGDNVYGITLPIDGVAFEYYYYTENNDAGLFYPARAEHEFLHLEVQIVPCANGQVVVNEILASNQNFNFDSNGEDDDWMELYNTSNVALDLSGLCLSDDIANLQKYTIPPNTYLGPNNRILIWCDKDTLQHGLHTNFKLSSSADQVIFSDGLNIYDQVAWNNVSSNIAWARCPDGSSSFAFSTPTPEEPNNCFASTETLSLENITVYPNPSKGLVYFHFDAQNTIQFEVLDCRGGLICQNSFLAAGMIDLKNLESGLYYMKFTIKEEEKSIVKKIVLVP